MIVRGEIQQDVTHFLNKKLCGTNEDLEQVTLVWTPAEIEQRNRTSGEYSNIQFSGWRIPAWFVYFWAFEYIEPLLGVDVIFQNWFVDGKWHRATSDYAVTGMKWIQNRRWGTFEDEAECTRTLATWDLSLAVVEKHSHQPHPRWNSIIAIVVVSPRDKSTPVS
jgi:hypothetical protein